MSQMQYARTNAASVDPVDEPIDYPNDRRYRRIDSQISQVGGIAQYLSEILSENDLHGTYRVVFPKGINEELVRHGQGYLSQ